MYKENDFFLTIHVHMYRYYMYVLRYVLQTHMLAFIRRPILQVTFVNGAVTPVQ